MNPEQNPNQSPASSPPPTPDQQAPQVVYVTRPMNPEKPQITPEAQQRYEQSIAAYPHLNLSKGEYVISAVRRHPIGLFQIWAIGGLVIIVLLTFVGALATNTNGVTDGLGSTPTTSQSLSLLSIPLLIIAIIVLIGCAIGTFIYRANKFFLTNESVIQNVQNGLFNKRLQTVSLGNVEDASFTQKGILPHMLNYGFIRLSTQGDETTYRFNFAGEPEKQVALLNNAVEAFKNGRPVEG